MKIELAITESSLYRSGNAFTVGQMTDATGMPEDQVWMAVSMLVGRKELEPVGDWFFRKPMNYAPATRHAA